MSQPLLSIGMIVKNEERCLEKCLKSLEPLRQVIPCELVIADTGSTDKTIEIAKKYADKLINFKWVNDFSKARNAVLDHCSGKWHLYIDADEYLVKGTSQLSDFLTSPTERNKAFASIIIRNHATPQMNGTYADFNSLRLFKTNPERRFTGTIHEYVPYTNPEDCYILTDVIFDHDGYTQITPKHLKEKGERNLKILEQELSANPTNIRTIIQCLEATTHNAKKRKYYTGYALNFLKNAPTTDSNWEILAPLCAFRILAYLIQDHSPLAEEFFQWSLKNFANSQYILVDAFFIYTKYLYEKQDFDATIDYGKKYFENLKNYEKSKHIVSQSSFINPLIFCNPYSQNEIKTLIGCSLLETRKEDSALKFLENIELNLCDNDTIKLWTKTVIESDSNIIHNKCKDIIYEILKNCKTNTKYDLAYNCIKEIFFEYFSCKNNTVNSFFENFILDTGVSYKIANAQTRKDAEHYLAEIESPEELMSIALKQSIILKCDLPEKFLSLPLKHLKKLFDDLIIAKNEILNALTEKYLTNITERSFYYISFFFNLSSALLFDKNMIVSNDNLLKLLPQYLNIAETYLNTCYTTVILENEDYVSCLQETHLLAWYLIKANKFKDEEPLEYVKTLRAALQKVPQAKELIEFLIKEFQTQENHKKQERIKNATPELVAMAEQLKTMLKAFPPNSPELLAIKQSPMYKQVAFLIEE